MNYPKLSIITPSYNQSKYLEKTIKSVIDQGYPNLEYIIIDGGSRDSSVSIIKSYEKYINYWVSEKDTGQSNAINKGFMVATGDILAWINSDDEYYPDCFMKVTNFFNQNPDVDLIYGDAVVIDQDGSFIKHRKEIKFDRIMGFLHGFGAIIPQPTVFFRSHVLKQVGFLNETIFYNMDGDYWGRVAKMFKIVHINSFLAKMRFHSQAKTIIFLKYNSNQILNELNLHRAENYSELWISKFIPLKYSSILRKIYFIKRVIIRFALGHYFKGYKHSKSIANKQIL